MTSPGPPLPPRGTDRGGDNSDGENRSLLLARKRVPEPLLLTSQVRSCAAVLYSPFYALVLRCDVDLSLFHPQGADRERELARRLSEHGGGYEHLQGEVGTGARDEIRPP